MLVENWWQCSKWLSDTVSQISITSFSGKNWPGFGANVNKSAYRRERWMARGRLRIIKRKARLWKGGITSFDCGIRVVQHHCCWLIKDTVWHLLAPRPLTSPTCTELTFFAKKIRHSHSQSERLNGSYSNRFIAGFLSFNFLVGALGSVSSTPAGCRR